MPLTIAGAYFADFDSIRDLEGRYDRWVPGSGQAPAGLAYVAEAPGRTEVQEGRALVGPSGDINWQFAFRYGGLMREGAWVTNWRKIPFSDADKKEISPDEIREWTALLEEELTLVQPRTVIALGGWAVDALLGPGHSLFWSNGIPIERAAGDFVVIPVVHPAAGMHESTMLQRTSDGYEGARRYFRGEVAARRQGVWKTAPPTRRVYGDTDTVFTSAPSMVALDTEGLATDPFSLQFSIDNSGAYFVPAPRYGGAAPMQAFKSWLYRVRPRIYLQGSLHDASVLKSFGIDAWEFEIVDLQILEYNLQNVPRDLKNLSRALLGLEMREYDEVVAPYQEAAEERWREKAYAVAAADLSLDQQFTRKGKARRSKGLPVFKRSGPEIQLGLAQHVERRQQLAPQEEAWAAAAVGPKPEKHLKLVPEAEAIEYAGTDAHATLVLVAPLEARVEAAGLQAVVDLDHAVLPLIHRWQEKGMHVDVEKYWSVLGEVTTGKLALEERLREVTGLAEFNPGSPDDVAEFCRSVWKKEGKLGLTELTKGYKTSTKKDALDPLRDDHPFIPLILDWREYQKYEGTYLLPLRGLIERVKAGEWRIYPNLRITTVVSGRLSAHAPNVLAWPARTELGLKVRSIFTAPDGYVLASWDLSQIEMRLAAAFSQDKVLTEAFVSGLDTHTNLASKLFRVEYAVAHEGLGKLLYRTPAKNIHYMLLYGGEAGKLFKMMKGALTRARCAELYRETWQLYAGVRKFMRATSEEARRLGYVSDYIGRRRFLPGARLVADDWPLRGLVLEAERQGGNYKIQGAASETLKRSMVTVEEMVYPECRRRGIDLELWLQVHDELMGAVPEGRFAEVNEMMTAAMEQDSWLLDPIKIVTEGKQGKSWAELK